MFKLPPAIVPRLTNYKNHLGLYQIKLFGGETWSFLNLKSSTANFNIQFIFGKHVSGGNNLERGKN